jgi:hypothetical protein
MLEGRENAEQKSKKDKEHHTKHPAHARKDTWNKPLTGPNLNLNNVLSP